MAQYQTNTNVQPHKPSMGEKVKAKAEGLMDKVTGQTHTGAHTGTTTGVGGAGTNVAGGGTGYAQQQPGYGEPQQQLGTNPGYAEQQPLGHHQQEGYAGQQHQPTTGATTAAYGQPKHQSMMDKVKGVITPGHQSDNVGAGHTTGTGYSSSTAQPSTMDKIKNKLPGHHQTTTGTGYDNQTTY